MTEQLVAPPETGPQRVVGRRKVVEATPVDGVAVVGSLSPSRAGDFMTCPLLYRFRTIDKLPEPSSPDAVRGTVIHKVLEDLFDLPATERTPSRAADMLPAAWEAVLVEDPEIAEMFGADGPELTSWLASCRDTLERYFTLEDPRRLEPAEREMYVETLLDSKLLLRGFVDRVDVAPNGAVRVVDYKSGRSPHEMFEAKALFQMKFYALVLWRLWGTIPSMLQLVYLGNSEMLRYQPEERDLLAVERKVNAIWNAIDKASRTGDWRPRKSALCSWCAHQPLCPEFGGTPPELPAREEPQAIPVASGPPA